MSQGLIKSVHEKLLPKYPGLKLIYYDLGLSNDQRKKVIISIRPGTLTFKVKIIP